MIGITGGRGILASIILEKYKKNGIQLMQFEGDITKYSDVFEWLNRNNITKIIHLASKVAVSDVQNNLTHAYDVNVTGTINILKSIDRINRDIGLFYSSSSHVYKSSKLPLKESDILEPINSYGLTKLISEKLLLDYNKNNPEFNLCIGRIFSFYHISQKAPFLYPNLLRRFNEEDLDKPFKVFGALSTRDFLNAEEVCDIIIKLIDKNSNGIVNIASGVSTSIVEFVEKVSPRKINIEYDINEETNHLNADISVLNKMINNK